MPRKMLSFIIAFPFFGIPRTYLAHTKVATEPHGRLSDMEQSWEVYTEQLTREYSEFVLAVCSFERHKVCYLLTYVSTQQSTVLLS